MCGFVGVGKKFGRGESCSLENVWQLLDSNFTNFKLFKNVFQSQNLEHRHVLKIMS